VSRELGVGAALRWILALPARCATVEVLGDIVDLFGDDVLGEDFADLFEPALDFEEVLLEEERLDEARPPFCAMDSKGIISRMSSTMAIRVRIANLLFAGCIIGAG